jgi:serine/threonine protein kinase
MVTRKPPFDDDSPERLMELIINEAYEPLPVGTAPEISDLVAMMLLKDPNERASIADLTRMPCLATYFPLS